MKKLTVVLETQKGNRSIVEMITMFSKEVFMRGFVITVLLFMPFSVSAAGLKCSIHPAKNTPTTALPGLVKVSQAEAQKTAFARIKAPSTAVAEGELEVEQGCLVYSFDIRIPGKPGIEEIMVDAGTGKILSHKHESTKQEAAEKAKDKVPSKK